MALTQISSNGIKDSEVKNADMADDAVGVAELSATGTASSSTFLRGDNSWVTPTDTNTQLAFANDANNRVVTGDGSGGLNGEANLTFDGSKLGINEDTPVGDLHVTTAGSSQEDGVVYVGGSNSTLGLKLSYDQSGNTSAKITTNSNYSNASSKLSICVDENANDDQLVLTGDGNVKIGDGNLIIGTAGHGIDFSANSHAGGMTSETFDSYEEGTWTPTVYSTSQGSFSYATNGQLGIYTKVGNIVHVNGFVQATVGGTETGQVRLGGLPFTVSNTGANYGQILITDYGNFDSYDGHLGGYVYPGQTYGVLLFSREGNSSVLGTSQWGTNTYVYFSLTYRVA